MFWLALQNIAVMFKTSTVKFVKLQNLVKKRKCLHLGPEMPYFGIFGKNF